MTRQSPTKRTLYSFKLDAATRERLENLAELENRSMAQIIEIAVEFYQNHKCDNPAPEYAQPLEETA